jgi:hypothetical protein
MADIKPLSKISQKWSSNSQVAGPAYRDGIQSPRRSWQTAAANADASRKAGLVNADARNAFVVGVNAAGDAKWQNNSIVLGPARFAQGVQNAEPIFQQGFSPYHAVIAGLTLPPRGPKGSPENINRVSAVATALHNQKTGGGGAGGAVRR